MSWYVQTFKDKDGDKDKNKNNKLVALHIDDDKLLEKYKTIWTETDDLQNIELNALPVHGVRYIKNKIRTYGDKVYKTCHCLNVPKDGVEYDSFTIFSVDLSPAYEKKYYLQVHLLNCAYKIVDKHMIDYLDVILFNSDED